MITEDATNAYYHAGVLAQAVTLRTAFDGYNGSSAFSGTGAALTPVQFLAAAEALTDVWHGEWVKLALAAEKTYIGADAASGIRATAATAVTTADNAKVDNEKNTVAMVRWKALATAEISAIQGDVGRARALLTALTEEVADTARLESTARMALDNAIAE